MATGIRALQKIALGVESTSTPGTLVVGTTRWRGMGMLQDNLVMNFPEEAAGNLGGSQLNYIAQYGGEVELTQDATFEQLPYVLTCGVTSLVAGVQDGAGSGYIYAYPFATTAVTDINTLTIIGGDNIARESLGYSFVPQFTLSGNGGEALSLSATFRGQQVAPYAVADTSTIPTVEQIIFSLGKMYIDNDTATIGTTVVTQTLLGMTLNVNTGWQEVHSADGVRTFSFIKQAAPEITLDVTFEHNASAVAEIAAWRANTPRQIKLLWEGSTLAGAGTAYTKKTLSVPLAGKWESFSKIDEQNGNDIVTGLFRARYSSVAALFASFTVVLDGVITLP
jgi:hypothetical protein